MQADQVPLQENMMNYDPSTVTGAIVWGIVAGILTSAALLLLTKIVQKIVLPWYQDLVFKGIDLSGEWASKKVNDDKVVYHNALNLRQNAHAISGTMTISKISAGPSTKEENLPDYVQRFEVAGSTWEGFVTLNMRSENRRNLAFATTLVRIEGRGDALIGHLAYRSRQADRVESEEIVWRRS